MSCLSDRIYLIYFLFLVGLVRVFFVDLTPPPFQLSTYSSSHSKTLVIISKQFALVKFSNDSHPCRRISGADTHKQTARLLSLSDTFSAHLLPCNLLLFFRQSGPERSTPLRPRVRVGCWVPVLLVGRPAFFVLFRQPHPERSTPIRLLISIAGGTLTGCLGQIPLLASLIPCALTTTIRLLKQPAVIPNTGKRMSQLSKLSIDYSIG